MGCGVSWLLGAAKTNPQRLAERRAQINSAKLQLQNYLDLNQRLAETERSKVGVAIINGRGDARIALLAERAVQYDEYTGHLEEVLVLVTRLENHLNHIGLQHGLEKMLYDFTGTLVRLNDAMPTPIFAEIARRFGVESNRLERKGEMARQAIAGATHTHTTHGERNPDDTRRKLAIQEIISQSRAMLELEAPEPVVILEATASSSSDEEEDVELMDRFSRLRGQD